MAEAGGSVCSSAVPSYRLLSDRVKKKTLSITFILGLPRGGTTAIEKHLYSHLAYDANVNEPSLHLDLGTPADSLEGRANLTFGVVLKAVEELERREENRNRSLEQKPLMVLVKEVTNKVLPGMVPLWIELSAAIIVIFRNPSLQLESRLKSIVDRVKSGALKPFGISDDVAWNKLSIHGRPLVIPGFYQGDSTTAFCDTYQDMVSRRDFSGLGPGLLRLQTLHPFCADPFSQAVMWGSSSPQPPPTLDQFESLPDCLCSQVLSWRLGWEPLRLQMLQLQGHPHVILLDFSSFQIAPDHLMAAVDCLLRSRCASWAEAMDAKLSSGGPAEKKQFVDDFSFHSAGWDDAAWNAWYGTPCYGKVSRRSDVEPVLKAPAPASHFPASCQQALSDALEVYSKLSVDARAVRPPARAAMPFLGIDPLYDGIWNEEATDNSRAAALRRFLSSNSAKEQVCNKSIAATFLHSLYVVPSFIALLCIQLLLLWQSAVVYIVLRIAAPIAGLSQSSARTAVAMEKLPKPCLLSIIIPSYNEEAFIATTLHSVRGADAAKSPNGWLQVEVVVVVDSGTNDTTTNIVQRVAASEDFPFPIKRVSSVRSGRGSALDEGIRQARGHILLFLHADCVLPKSWDTMVTDALSNSGVHATAFRFCLNRERLAGLQPPPGLLFLEFATNLRSSLLQLPFGDQAIALRASQLLEIGGLPIEPIFEDYSLMLCLLWQGSYTGRNVELLSKPVYCAPRRWEQKGLWWTSCINLLAIFAYICGVPTSRIFQFYYGRKP